MQHDAIVIGGSFAGPSAAIHIARARRSVCVIDAGSPCNRFADTSHGFFSQNGSEPRAMIASARAQLQRYPTGRTVAGEQTALYSLLLADRREAPIDAIYLAPRSRLNSTIAEQLGCTLDDRQFGPVIRTDATKLTTVPGVYAARAPHNASWAAADGVTAGVSLYQSLVFEPLAPDGTDIP